MTTKSATLAACDHDARVKLELGAIHVDNPLSGTGANVSLARKRVPKVSSAIGTHEVSIRAAVPFRLGPVAVDGDGEALAVWPGRDVEPLIVDEADPHLPRVHRRRICPSGHPLGAATYDVARGHRRAAGEESDQDRQSRAHATRWAAAPHAARCAPVQVWP